MHFPLAETLRPKTFDQVAGQENVVSFLNRIIAGKKPLSLIFWGPPGTGKTTLARLYAQGFSAKFISLSAVSSGVSDLKKIISDAEARPLFDRYPIVFVDEIHRFNKAQQDIFLPYLERGMITLIGATTENPSFALNNALLSRLRVCTLQPLSDKDLEKILYNYEKEKHQLALSDEVRKFLISNAQGDGRYLLNLVENLEQSGFQKIGIDELQLIFQKRSALSDKTGEYHYNLISALHKSVRGSDPDSALYWFARMIEGGEDPLFITRRVIRMAVEDIGLSDPEGLKIAVAAKDAYEMLGSPEGELAIAEAIIYLALAPKSNALYNAYKGASQLASETSHLSPPKIILNAPTKMMKELDYGKGYEYDHETTHGFSGQNYFPDDLNKKEFYKPNERGFERELKKRLIYFETLRKKLVKKDGD